MEEIAAFFTFTSMYSPIIPLIMVLLWKRFEWPAKIIWIFVFVSFSTDQLISYLNSISFWEDNNFAALAFYSFIESALLVFFYFMILDRKKWILWVGLLFLILLALDITLIEYGQFVRKAYIIRSFFFVTAALYTFHQFFIKSEILWIENSPTFWFNIAILFYFSGSFFSFLLYSVESMDIWIVHNISNTLKNAFIAIGFWKTRSTIHLS